MNSSFVEILAYEVPTTKFMYGPRFRDPQGVGGILPTRVAWFPGLDHTVITERAKNLIEGLHPNSASFIYGQNLRHHRLRRSHCGGLGPRSMSSVALANTAAEHGKSSMTQQQRSPLKVWAEGVRWCSTISNPRPSCNPNPRNPILR